ncbi:MAG: nucleotide exchange factor GrpE [Syntrophobacterales bacterium CG03_land_8_20_14_0_80_58_14]|nr:MAG: nucleotide exchange factor GrpE [Syntrophobacterales bacterium CG03_land_8_20_14_0_80_58_14]
MHEEIEEMEEPRELNKFAEVNELEKVNDDGGIEPAATPPWQDKILDNCLSWLEDLQEEPVLAETEEQPDLYSFYEELCVLRNEFRKNSRRSHETFLQFGEHLGDFKGVMTSLAQRLDNLTKEQENTEFIARQGILLQIVEIHERMRRFDEKLKEMNAPPPRGHLAARPGLWERMLGRGKVSPRDKGKWKDHKKQIGQVNQADRQEKQDMWGHDAASCSHSVMDGFFLAMSHFDEFLAGEGVRCTPTTGAPFDPAVMIAVGVVATDTCPPHTVVEEISGGYLYGDHVLKLAKVTISKQKEP